MQVGRDLILQGLERKVNEFVVLDALTRLPFRSPQKQKLFCPLYQKVVRWCFSFLIELRYSI